MPDPVDPVVDPEEDETRNGDAEEDINEKRKEEIIEIKDRMSDEERDAFESGEEAIHNLAENIDIELECRSDFDSETSSTTSSEASSDFSDTESQIDEELRNVEGELGKVKKRTVKNWLGKHCLDVYGNVLTTAYFTGSIILGLLATGTSIVSVTVAIIALSKGEKVDPEVLPEEVQEQIKEELKRYWNVNEHDFWAELKKLMVEDFDISLRGQVFILNIISKLCDRTDFRFASATDETDIINNLFDAYRNSAEKDMGEVYDALIASLDYARDPAHPDQTEVLPRIVATEVIMIAITRIIAFVEG